MNDSNNALEQLVRQFSQPLSFFRELIQNSLDAGSTQIEVTVDKDPQTHQIFLRVHDNGQGMTEDVIDNRLTRLFSSTKEDDFTKIGKFGVGFVSIFAVHPELVVLDTGCEGENWRVIFKANRSFEKRRLRQPIEGTSVTLYLPHDHDKDLNYYLEGGLNTVRFWCKFAETEILFNGERINQEFGFQETTYQYRYATAGTEAVLLPDPSPEGFQGYYNRGLTLLEGPGSPIPHLRFRMRSRYLEHTLSRDNILQDENYRKAMEHLHRAAFEEMPLHLFEQIQRAPSPQLWRMGANCLKLAGVKDRVGRVECLPTSRGLLSLNQLTSTIHYREKEDELWEAVGELDETILVKGSTASGLVYFLEAAGCQLRPLEESYILYSKVTPDEDDERVLRLLAERASHLPSPFLVDIKMSPPGWLGSRLGLYLNPSSKARSRSRLDRQKGDFPAIVANSLLFKKVRELAKVDRELALSVLVRKLHLDLGLGKKKEKQILTDSLLRLKSQEAKV